MLECFATPERTRRAVGGEDEPRDRLGQGLGHSTVPRQGGSSSSAVGLIVGDDADHVVRLRPWRRLVLGDRLAEELPGAEVGRRLRQRVDERPRVDVGRVGRVDQNVGERRRGVSDVRDPRELEQLGDPLVDLGSVKLRVLRRVRAGLVGLIVDDHDRAGVEPAVLLGLAQPVPKVGQSGDVLLHDRDAAKVGRRQKRQRLDGLAEVPVLIGQSAPIASG